MLNAVLGGQADQLYGEGGYQRQQDPWAGSYERILQTIVSEAASADF
jgi:hypothetical protein